MKLNFGIDFGTTNSACIGIIDGKEAITFADEYDGTPFPSIVIIDPVTSNVYCGREYWTRRHELAETCEVIASIKTHLGTDMKWNLGGRTWYPSDIAAEILKGLKKSAEKASGGIILDSATFAVPVGFSSEKRADLRLAAQKAGIQIESFISESTAAFFKYYKRYKHFTKIGVIDWGGGTLDISILENRSGTIRELATEGVQIGGDVIDKKMAEWVHNRAISQKGLEVEFDQMPPKDRDLLISRCEREKRNLSAKDVVEVSVLKYGDIGVLRQTIDIETFSRLIYKEVSEAIECFENALAKAHLSAEELDCVLMVGGSVNLRPFIDKVEEKWSFQKIWPEDAVWAVANGASLLNIARGEYQLEEDIGMIVSDGSFYPLIKAGENLEEFNKRYTFSLTEDSTTANLIFADNHKRMIGYLNVPAFGFFREKIDLDVTVDKNLILGISAQSTKRSNKYRDIFKYSGLKFNYKLPESKGE